MWHYTTQALPNTTVVTFDTFEQSYQHAALHHMRHDLGLSSRLHVSIGDTLHSVRNFAEAHRHMRCDLAHPSLPGREHSDLLALHAMSRIPTALVMTTVLRKQSVSHKRTTDSRVDAWDDALRDGLIWNSTCLPATRPRTVGSGNRFIQRASQEIVQMSCDSAPFENLDRRSNLGPKYCMATRVSAHPSFVFAGWATFSAAPPLHSALVMTEMGNRVLARSIAQSSVVLVGRPQPQQMLGRLAASQGHEVVSITRSLKERLGGLSRDWVLLLFVDAGGNEAPVLSATLQALGRATVTYIVMRFQPRAVTKLFEKGYKVMMLSCTDLIPHFPPNALITRDNVAMLNNALTSREGHAYIFATQGLDLAIPSRQDWNNRRCNPDEPDQCKPRAASSLFARNASSAHLLERTTGNSTAWFSHEDPQLAEAACETFRCERGQSPQVSCSTRVLIPPSMRATEAALRRKPKDRTITKRPNLLLLLIDPISRGEFSRSLPRLSRLLPALGYDTFTQYAAVGNNSGPNQAALYRGRPLRSRQDLVNSTWLWDKLSRKGYATFKGEVRHMPDTPLGRCLQRHSE